MKTAACTGVQPSYLLDDIWLYACFLSLIIFCINYILYEARFDSDGINGIGSLIAEPKYILRDQDDKFISWDNDLEFRWLSTIATIIFLSSALRSLFSLLFIHKGQRPPVFCVIFINLVAATTHYSFAVGSYPVMDNCFGRKTHVLRFAEWTSLVFFLMVILNALHCTDRYELYRSAGAQFISVVFGCASMFSCQLDWGGDNLPHSDGHWMHRGSSPNDKWWDPSTFTHWSRSFTISMVFWIISLVTFVDIYRVAALRMSMQKSDGMAAVIQVSLWCAVSWTFVVLIYMLGSLNVDWFNGRTELILTTIMDLIAKMLYANLLGDTHLQLQEVENGYRSQLALKDEINDSQSHFLRYVFHEVRVPLNTIRLGLESISLDNSTKQSITEDGLYVFSCMDEASTAMSDTLNDVLAFQKIKEGKVKLSITAINMRCFIDDIVNGFGVSLKGTDTQVVDVVDPDVPATTYGDSLRIRQVITHFVSYILKRHKSKTVTLSVFPLSKESSENTPKDAKVRAGSLRFSVQIKGDVLSPQAQSQLFEAYQQIRTGDVVSGDGTSGLGLSICKQLVELMGGSIGANCVADRVTYYFTVPMSSHVSAPSTATGFIKRLFSRSSSLDSQDIESSLHQETEISPKGDAFTQKDDLLLPPLRRASVFPSLSQTTSPRFMQHRTTVPSELPSLSKPMTSEGSKPVFATSKSLSEGAPLQVLVVDDVKLNRSLMKRCVQQLKFDADEAKDGVEAVVMCEKKSYDLILMDNSMPRMTGIQATQAIRAKHGNHSIVFGVTGNALSEDVEEFKAAGCNEVLLKPLKFDKFLNCLDKHGIENDTIRELVVKAKAKSTTNLNS